MKVVNFTVNSTIEPNMDLKLKYLCGFYNREFTRNVSLKSHKENVHLKQKFNCITCNKTYRRPPQALKKCLIEKLEHYEENTIDLTGNKSAQDNPTLNLVEDLTLSSSSDTSIRASS